MHAYTCGGVSAGTGAGAGGIFVCVCVCMCMCLIPWCACAPHLQAGAAQLYDVFVVKSGHHVGFTDQHVQVGLVPGVMGLAVSACRPLAQHQLQAAAQELDGDRPALGV